MIIFHFNSRSGGDWRELKGWSFVGDCLSSIQYNF